MLDALIQGILLGGYFALLAAGLSLMFGVVRFINLAHGDMAVLGAMLALWAVQGLGLPVIWAIVLVLPVMAGLGWAMQALAGRGATAMRIEADPGAEAFYLRMGARRIGVAPSEAIPGRMLPLLEIAPLG